LGGKPKELKRSEYESTDMSKVKSHLIGLFIR